MNGQDEGTHRRTQEKRQKEPSNTDVNEVFLSLVAITVWLVSLQCL